MISLVIPCYNEYEVLDELFSRITKAALTWNDSYEVIIIDDFSDDNSKQSLQEKNSLNPNWKIIGFAKNFGQQAAIMAGLQFAKGDCAVIMDADLQDPPEIIGRFLEKWKEGYSVVYAIRYNRKENILKKIAYKLFYYILTKLANTKIPPDAGDFCLIDRKVIDILKTMPEKNPFIRGLRAWPGFKQIGITYDRQGRAAGKPKYTFAKLRQLAIDGLFSFSVAPIRLTIYLGLIISALSFGVAIYTLVWRLLSDYELPGYATIAIGVLFLGGIQLLSIGILGEYIGRIYDEVKKRPLWVIDYTIGFRNDEIKK